VRRLGILTWSVLIGLAGGTGVLHAQDNRQPKTLIQAARDGDAAEIKAHIAKGEKLDQPDAVGWTPLRATVEFNHTEAALALIEGGANVNVKDELGRTPLILACMRGAKEIVDALLARKADVTAKDASQRTALHVAAQMGNPEIVEALVKAGADVNAEDASRQTPMTLARQVGRTEIVEMLQQHGAKEPAPLLGPDSLYGGYGPGQTGGPQSAAPSSYAPPEVKVDPNAIMAQLKEFPDVVQALQEVDKKSDVEQRAWIQRRSDNRTGLLAAAQKQFEDEMVFVKKFAADEKAEKTTRAVDELTAKRKKREAAISEALREQRRETMQSQSQNPGADMYGRGRAGTGMRTTRGGSATGRGGMTMNPSGGPGTGATRPVRRADVNEPVIDAQTQHQIQAWVNAKPEDKKNLIETVHQQDLADLDGLQQIATEGQARKTTAAIMGLMMMRERRVANVAQKWLEDEERMKKLQERYGTQGMPGAPGTMPGDSQTGTRRGTRRR
jgi:hypothetical protein